jgi:uracil-DNA glycosylase
MKERLKELLGESWYNQLSSYLNSPDFNTIWNKLSILRYHFQDDLIPHIKDNLLFKAFRSTPYYKIKIVILGQDPYHDLLPSGLTRYDGLAFSNSNNSDKDRVSLSLRNIFTELENDIGKKDNLNLYSWAQQGVLLINTAHTVLKGDPGVHAVLWQGFTLEVIQQLNKKRDLVWILWGNHAKSFKFFISNPTHYIIEGTHPAARFTTKFFNQNYFSKCNKQLEARNIKPINWLL